MPIALDPDQTIDVWLPSDAEKPAETRPTFKTRFMSWGERRRVADLRQEAIDAKDGDAAWGKLEEVMKIAARGWRNMGDREFSPETLRDVLTLQELFDLTGVFLEETRLKESDLRNFRSQPQSAGAGSAPAAPSASPDATPPASPSGSPASTPAAVETNPAPAATGGDTPR